MNVRNLRFYKYYVLGSLVLAFVFRYLIISQDIVSTLEVAGILAIVIVLAIYSGRLSGRPELLWNDALGVMTVLRPWRVEVSAARLITSVPIGIDLEHSAVQVLRAMYSRALGKNVAIKFFVFRPLGNGPTRIGMMVTHYALRLTNGVARASKLAKKVIEDASVLESAMRASYPHVPIVRAGVEEILSVYSGGVYGAD